MRLFRLAKILELKYGLISKTASIQQIIDDVKRDIINAYNLYVGDKSKVRVLEYLANHGDPYSKSIIAIMQEIVSNIDTLSTTQLFNRVNKILGIIHHFKNDPNSEFRKNIFNSVYIGRESDNNFRQNILSKLEMVNKRLSSILEKQAKLLQKFIPNEASLLGGAVEQQRKELSKDKLLMFMRTPAASKYGLGSLEMLEKILVYPDLRQKITTLINAIDRGHIPVDGPEIMQITQEIMEAYKQKDNSELFGEEKT